MDAKCIRATVTKSNLCLPPVDLKMSPLTCRQGLKHAYIILLTSLNYS